MPKKEREDDKRKKTRGEEGFWERSVEAAQEASHEAKRIFKTPEEFTAAADAYFADCDSKGKLYGEAGLCLYLSSVVGRPVTLKSLREWYDGTKNPGISEAVQQAYLRIQEQIETNEAYQQKGMVTKAIFLSKQARFGGYQDRQEIAHDAEVKVTFGKSVDNSDFA